MSSCSMYSKDPSSLLHSAPFKEDYSAEQFNHPSHPATTPKEQPIDFQKLFAILLKTSDLSPLDVHSAIATIKASRTKWKSMTVERRKDQHLRTAETGMPMIYEANQRGEEFLALKKEGELLGKGEFRTTQTAVFLSHGELQVVAHLTQKFESKIAKLNSNDELRILHKIRHYQRVNPRLKGLARFLGYVDYHSKTLTGKKCVYASHLSRAERISDYDHELFNPNKLADNPHEISLHEKRALVFKLYSGGTLSEKIDSLDLLNRLKVAVFLLDGLTLLHCLGIFHSDLKEENILLEMDSDSKMVSDAVISDFGFSIDFYRLDKHCFKNGDFKCRAPEFMSIVPGTEIDQKFAFSGDVYSMGLIIKSLIKEIPMSHPIFRLTERMTHHDSSQRITAREATREFKILLTNFMSEGCLSSSISSSSLM